MIRRACSTSEFSLLLLIYYYYLTLEKCLNKQLVLSAHLLKAIAPVIFEEEEKAQDTLRAFLTARIV